jgi:TDG/mug DNA glycosylase family protein
MHAPHRPTVEEIAAARGKRVPDILAADLRILFCGINPSLYSAAVGHHFARPGNRFWPALHLGGFTNERLSPCQDGMLPTLGWGITNLVARATATAAELTEVDLVRGSRVLERKVRRYSPRVVAFLGVGSYRTAFARPRAALGPQPERMGGAAIWVLPNPSGLNAHYQLANLGRLFAELRRHIE